MSRAVRLKADCDMTNCLGRTAVAKGYTAIVYNRKTTDLELENCLGSRNLLK